MLKRVLKVVGVLVLVLALGVAWLIFTIVGGVKSVVDGTELPGGAVQVAQGYTSAFILDAGDGKVALIDCNEAAGAKEILGVLARRKLGADAVTAIFLTHGHPDHIGGCQAFPKAEVFAFPGDVDQAAGRARFKAPLPSLMSIPPERQVKVTQLLEDGKAVQVGRLSVLPLATPGDTPGSAAFVVDGVAYLGDNAAGRTDGTARPATWVFCDDTAQNLRSLGALSRRLTALDPPVKVLAFSHSDVLQGLSALKVFEASGP